MTSLGQPSSIGASDSSMVAPGAADSSSMSPTPMANQKQANLTPTDSNESSQVPLPTPRPAIANPYAQPTALDPQSIEELRTSLMTQAGQLDPDNPNSLAARLASPLSDSDIGQQRNEAMSIEDSVRGFDGVKKAKIAEANKGKQ